MDIVLKMAEKIWTKYRALIIPVYGLIALYFMYLVWNFVDYREIRDKLYDSSFITKQIEKINIDEKDFKYSDVAYIDMVCQQYRNDYFIQRNCKIINNFLDKKGVENGRRY